jgi:hypothetical protein
MTIEINDTGCTWKGSQHFPVVPGLINTLKLQLDSATPAYQLQISGNPSDLIPTTRTGPSCPGGPGDFISFPLWASTGPSAHTSPSLTLVDSEPGLTPPDFDTTTRWSLTPG